MERVVVQTELDDPESVVGDRTLFKLGRQRQIDLLGGGTEQRLADRRICLDVQPHFTQ
jgi:hypothetical protein